MSFRLCCVLVLALLEYIDGQRRVKDGVNVSGDKNYMVYLVQAKSSARNYNGWICGGAIVSRWYILTSAACVEDVQSMYAISGTRSYISSASIFINACTLHTKKKVVFTCIPKEYVLDFGKVENWSFNDIAIVKVETAYVFDGGEHDKHCDYIPSAIKINFDVQKEQEGTDVIVLGYGHSQFWREPKVNDDWNNAKMQYSSSKIYNVENCKQVYKYPDLFQNIDKYMICTNGSGIIDETGKPLAKGRSFRRIQHEHSSEMPSERKNNNLTVDVNTRRSGFCQNDHGGPLVAWINGEETVIGVASVFRVNKERKCTGPYLYTSTARNKMFIECIVNDQLMSRRSDICNQPASLRGFSILRRYIVWDEDDHHCRGPEELVDPDVPDVVLQYIANHHTVTTSEDDEHKHRRNVRIYKFLWTTATQPGKY